MFNKKLSTLIKNIPKKRQNFAMIFLDLDRFKYINDTLGHLAGDELLKEVASRLKLNIKRSDMVSRFAGDEFVILLANINSRKQIDQVIKRISKAFENPFKLSQGEEIYMTFSMGISIFPNDGTTAEKLLKNADKSLYDAKEEGGNGHAFGVIPSWVQ